MVFYLLFSRLIKLNSLLNQTKKNVDLCRKPSYNLKFMQVINNNRKKPRIKRYLN